MGNTGSNIVRINQGLILTARGRAPVPEVAGRPFVEHAISHLARFGVRDIVLLADEAARARYHGRRLYGADLSVLADPHEQLRARLAERLEEICFVANGETFFDADLLPLIKMAQDSNWIGSALLPSPNNVNGGIALIQRQALLDSLAPNAHMLDLMHLAAAGKLAAVPGEGYFADIRSPQGLQAARTGLAGARTRPAAFLDRDGTLNVDRSWTHRADQLEWIADAPAAVRMLNRAGYYVFVVTNQGGVARGFYEEAAIERLHEHMQAHLMSHGAHIDAFYHCPHHPEGVVKSFAIECLCRKPGVGMLEQAARDWPVDRAKSFMIGDRDTDIEAAAAFGVRGILFDPEKENLLQRLSQELAVRA